MKNIINCFLKVNLGFIFVISSNLSNVSALDYTNDQDTIFPKEEVNELITKANNLEITNGVIDIKTEIENIREQVQNIE